MDRVDLWHRYRQYLWADSELGLRLDISRMHFAADFFDRHRQRVDRAFVAMAALEGGQIANPDEDRQVGHYWLRNPQLAPSVEIRAAITDSLTQVRQFAAAVHQGLLAPSTGAKFTDLLIIGIGGSALGPQLAADALGEPAADRLHPHFFDNTDPDGQARVLGGLGARLASTLVLVISKSGGTAETRNGMLAARAAWAARGLEFARQAVAVTGAGSRLDQLAQEEGWLERFPMWDWVGGRTSETCVVGLLPAALQGIDIDALLAGAAACDQRTRVADATRNPAALLALMWLHATGGRGERDMVVLPYKDRLLLFSRYLQQLVMESLGKGTDLQGNSVEQGIAVYGNKGSTDQHAYVQQLREGVNNFFVTFIEVLEEGGEPLEVEPGVTRGDYLRGFLYGTRQALSDNGRESITLTVDRVDAYSLGVLIALFERAVGLYASLVGINAYHQPGVEAGKKAAAEVLDLQSRAVAHLRAANASLTVEELATELGETDRIETLFQVLEALCANRREVACEPGKTSFDGRFRALARR